jgi:hypothetical protein
MRLADDELTITLPSRVFVLRASLRAAFQLNLKYEGFQNLSRAIAGGNFSACSDLISATCTDSNRWTAYVVTRESTAVRELLDIRDQLLEFVLILAGAKSTSDEPAQTAEPITFDEYHTKLFQIATGWLGWSPADAWNATPAEITSAHQGRLEMLKAIFGGKRDDTEIDPASPKDRAELNALGDLNVTTMSQVR